MNNQESGNSFELPAVPIGDEVDSIGGETLNAALPEKYTQPSQPTISSQPVKNPAGLTNPVLPPSPQHGPKSTPLSNTPQIADDNDLIEKEWVIKAKQIVASTKDDPRRQNFEISRFRADYLKKRYNKDIKIEEA